MGYFKLTVFIVKALRPLIFGALVLLVLAVALRWFSTPAAADLRIYLGPSGIGIELGPSVHPNRYYYDRVYEDEPDDGYYYDKDDYPDPPWLQEEYAARDRQDPYVPHEPAPRRRYYDGDRCNQPPLCLKETRP